MFAASSAWAAPCGNVTYVGCCSGTTAKYCSKGTLKTKDCTKDTKYGPKCGWVASKKFYSCSKTSTADPSGKNVMDCSKLPTKPDGGTSTKKDYGTSKKDAGPTVACGGVSSKGCCEGNKLKYCYKNSLKTKTCSGSTPQCGWSTSKSYYTCGSSGLADPSGKYPRACGSSSTKDSGTSTKQDKGGLTQKDSGGGVQADSAINPPKKKDDSGSCSVGGHSTSGLALTLALLALALRRRRA